MEISEEEIEEEEQLMRIAREQLAAGIETYVLDIEDALTGLDDETLAAMGEPERKFCLSMKAIVEEYRRGQ